MIQFVMKCLEKNHLSTWIVTMQNKYRMQIYRKTWYKGDSIMAQLLRVKHFRHSRKTKWQNEMRFLVTIIDLRQAISLSYMMLNLEAIMKRVLVDLARSTMPIVYSVVIWADKRFPPRGVQLYSSGAGPVCFEGVLSWETDGKRKRPSTVCGQSGAHRPVHLHRD